MESNVQISRLTFIRRTRKVKQGKRLVWAALYKCECGNEKEIIIQQVNRGQKSCGCIVSTLKGASQQPLYSVWKLMISRCYNEKAKDYNRYGERGIEICDQWKLNFWLFQEWCFNNGYKKGLQIDRIDTNGNYDPDNCRFVTPQENCNNRRSSLFVTINGFTKTFSQWCRIYGISTACAYQRKRKGLPQSEWFKSK